VQAKENKSPLTLKVFFSQFYCRNKRYFSHSYKKKTIGRITVILFDFIVGSILEFRNTNGHCVGGMLQF
jgi:hypothetical protein